ncbi:SCO family protein [Paracoccus shanxieyensis]|uniref:SCO family protein n=1 Tax=Paracoccus shanxieyensis TaxID=2675752 RepID=A0A6L6IZ09_9RHOB|nr:SCO family protein [Paracoccus shanxieyensis]MTH64330.1 SCO family protein [Paracoccus shanxieyensis]MTH87677.1 SCO family protein [Paracoccus shanxieyensis]
MPTTDPKRNPLSLIRWLLWSLVAIALVGVAWFFLISPRLQTLSESGIDALGRGDYQLVATDGSAFTQETLKGQPSAVFFGFTHCPDVCPTTLGDIAGWQEDLAEKQEKLRAFLITVDPQRDTADILRDYVSWVPGVTGVTGSEEEIAKATRAFRIYARKVPTEGGDYTMDHSAMVLLFDAQGNYFGLINYQEDPARARDSLDRLMAAS